jgi:predicted nucleic-acid-binding protein
MVVAADTNVLIRLLVADDAAQHRATVARLRKIAGAGGRVLVTSVTLVEVSWVLKARYKYRRDEIAAALEGILRTPPLEVVDPAPAVAALARYRRGPADFADYFTLELGLSAGAERLLTFDQQLLTLAECDKP